MLGISVGGRITKPGVDAGGSFELGTAARISLCIVRLVYSMHLITIFSVSSRSSEWLMKITVLAWLTKIFPNLRFKIYISRRALDKPRSSLITLGVSQSFSDRHFLSTCLWAVSSLRPRKKLILIPIMVRFSALNLVTIVQALSSSVKWIYNILFIYIYL